MTTLSTPKIIGVANDDPSAYLKIHEVGVLTAKLPNRRVISLTEVHLAPHLAENLLSVKRLCDFGYSVLFTQDNAIVYDASNNVLFKAVMNGNFWCITFQTSSAISNTHPDYALHIVEDELSLGGSELVESTESSLELDAGITVTVPPPLDHGYVPKECVPTFEPGESLTYNDIHDKLSLKLFLDAGQEIAISDLKEISEHDIDLMKPCIGLLWHKRLGHISKDGLKNMAKKVPRLQGIAFPESIKDCEVCKLAKATRLSSSSVRQRASSPFQLVHSDLIGPLTPLAYPGNERYIVTFLDDFSRFLYTYPILDKKKVHEAFAAFLRAVHMSHPTAQIRCLRSDNGTEYQTVEFKTLLKSHNITWEPAPPYTPELNGVAERLNRDILEKIRALLLDSGFPARLWTFALHYASYLYNRTPKSALDGHTPAFILLNKTDGLQFVKRFGSLVFAYDHNHKIKFAPRAKRFFFLTLLSNCTLVLDPFTGKRYKTKHVHFVESKVYGFYFGPRAGVPFQDPPKQSIRDINAFDFRFSFSDQQISIPPTEIELVPVCFANLLSISPTVTLCDYPPQFTVTCDSVFLTPLQKFTDYKGTRPSIGDSSSAQVYETRFFLHQALHTHVYEDGNSDFMLAYAFLTQNMTNVEDIFSSTVNQSAPLTYKQALKHSSAAQWQKAIQR